ncbi:DUF6286 domain-containing protein [Streptomyces sp. NBC_00820]|uniref:DUF6286 domain-containing protein n=1 Tax=Streptomyces sp. NBC_00820 TaxID=2975842 RepID=UPI002ECFCA10|nr:DUF6286 domain-containing protein [Streptomyces sp. NBC_00820]
MTPEPDHPGRFRSSSASSVPREPAPPAHEPSEPEPVPEPIHPAVPTPEPAPDDHDGRRRAPPPVVGAPSSGRAVASVILVAAGAALFDVVAVRAGNPAAGWRRHLADELATRPVSDVWMLTGAAVAAAGGLWLIVLALSPGLRHQLPLRSPAGCSPPRLRAALDRDGAAALLRDAALRVSGVSAARVRVRRHRVKVRADVRFRDAREVKNDLTNALDEERERLALARPPRVVVRVRHHTP